MNDKKIRGRFAPSPSGRLHLGNMLSSLLAWLDIRSLGGEMVFRLEDLDPDRSNNEYAVLMAQDLEWLGLDWDIGWRPEKPDKFNQSGRSELYLNQFDKLVKQGDIYPCYCTRAQRLAASAPHPGEARETGCGCAELSEEQKYEYLQHGRKPSYKIRVTNEVIQFNDAHLGMQSFPLNTGTDDFIVRRSDGVFAYQFAVSYDDAVMGINRVVRACDLLDSTPKQIWLIRKFGYTEPTYCHAPLLVTSDGRKMSKRDGGLSMEGLRRNHTPDELCGKLAFIAGLIDRPDAISPTELIPLFSWDKVPKAKVYFPEDLFE